MPSADTRGFFNILGSSTTMTLRFGTSPFGGRMAETPFGLCSDFLPWPFIEWALEERTTSSLMAAWQAEAQELGPPSGELHLQLVEGQAHRPRQQWRPDVSAR